MRRTGLILLGLALILLIGRIGLGFLRAPDDAGLIREALNETTKAAREGRPGGVLDYLSAEASLNGQKAPDVRGIADSIRRYSPDVKLNSTDATIAGNEARVVTAGEVSFGILNARATVPLNRVTITLTKEEDRDFLIIPTHRWRVTKVEVPEQEATDLIQKLGGLYGG